MARMTTRHVLAEVIGKIEAGDESGEAGRTFVWRLEVVLQFRDGVLGLQPESLDFQY